MFRFVIYFDNVELSGQVGFPSAREAWETALRLALEYGSEEAGRYTIEVLLT